MQQAWHDAITDLAQGRCTLSGLWGDVGAVHMALIRDRELNHLRLPCPDGTFPSVAASHPPASLLERTLADLFGLTPLGAPDTRPWLDHGQWEVRHPLGAGTGCRTSIPLHLPPRRG